MQSMVCATVRTLGLRSGVGLGLAAAGKGLGLGSPSGVAPGFSIAILGVWHVHCVPMRYPSRLYGRGRRITRVGSRTRFSGSLNTAHACSLPQRESVALFPDIDGGEVRAIDIACGNHGSGDTLHENERKLSCVQAGVTRVIKPPLRTFHSAPRHRRLRLSGTSHEAWAADQSS